MSSWQKCVTRHCPKPLLFLESRDVERSNEPDHGIVCSATAMARTVATKIGVVFSFLRDPDSVVYQAVVPHEMELLRSLPAIDVNSPTLAIIPLTVHSHTPTAKPKAERA